MVSGLAVLGDVETFALNFFGNAQPDDNICNLEGNECHDRGPDKHHANGLRQSHKRYTSERAGALGRAADDISSLEVATYTSPNLDSVKYDYASKKYTGQLALRALTRVGFDGDMQVCVPEKASGGVDRDMWQIHLDMVKEAQANRAEFLRSMAEMATRLIDILKP